MGASTIWSYIELFGEDRIARAVFVDQAPLQVDILLRGFTQLHLRHELRPGQLLYFICTSDLCWILTSLASQHF